MIFFLSFLALRTMLISIAGEGGGGYRLVFILILLFKEHALLIWDLVSVCSKLLHKNFRS